MLTTISSNLLPQQKHEPVDLTSHSWIVRSVCSHVTPRVFFGACVDGENEEVGQCTENQMMMKTGPRAAFKMVNTCAPTLTPTTTRQAELSATAAAISSVAAPHVETILVDSGFYSEAAVQAVECKPDGTPSGVTVLAAVVKLSHHKTVADLLPQSEPPAPGPEASAKERMAHRLKTASGKALSKLR